MAEEAGFELAVFRIPLSHHQLRQNLLRFSDFQL
jgi:hypothetical protein